MSVCGIGELGVMKDGSTPKTKENGKHTREYTLWTNMLRRCYSDKFHEKYPTYKDCTVCDRWLVFANFLEDLPLIEGYELWKNGNGYCLDKDIKQQGIKNKVYSLDTCKFINNRNNIDERMKRCGVPSAYMPKKVMAKSMTETKVLIFKSMSQAEKFGFDKSHISQCCNGKQKSHKGYTWSYLK